MERSVAIKKLTKLLGKSLGYRVDPTAPDADTRAAAQEELRLAIPERDALSKAKDARMQELLRGDAEFQRLKAAHEEARKSCDKLGSIIRHHRITVGTSNSLFFSIKAEGDSWEQVIAKLQASR